MRSRKLLLILESPGGETVDTRDLKSLAAMRAGSIPVLGTNKWFKMNLQVFQPNTHRFISENIVYIPNNVGDETPEFICKECGYHVNCCVCKNQQKYYAQSNSTSLNSTGRQ